MGPVLFLLINRSRRGPLAAFGVEWILRLRGKKKIR